MKLAVLAAAAADDDAGRSIAANLIAVSGGDGSAGGRTATGGLPPARPTRIACQPSRPENASTTTGESGPIGFDASGDITSANFMVFTYGADNKAKLSGREAAGRAAG